MKSFIRLQCVALILIMLMSLGAAASADTPSIYIPNRLSKLVIADVEDYQFPALATWRGSEYLNFSFSERPDWFGAVVSSKNGGWIDIPVNWRKRARLEIEDLVLQPGAWSWKGVARVDGPKLDEKGNPVLDRKGNIVPDYENAVLIAEGRSLNRQEKKRDENWYYRNLDNQLNNYPFYIQRHSKGDDSPYLAGKDYGDYSVTVNYHRDGSAYKVAVSLKNVDLFETGVAGATSTITFELVNVELDSYDALYLIYNVPIGGKIVKRRAKTIPDNNLITTVWDDEGNIDYVLYLGHQFRFFDLSNTDVWYVSSVSATYPENNYIVGVEADFKNDEKNSLSQYKISYAVNETDVVKIYYKTTDDAFYGQYSSDGTITAVSGSGDNLDQWYKYNGSSEDVFIRKPIKDEDGNIIKYVSEKEIKLNNNGKQMKKIKKGISSYPTPRVTTK